MRNKIKVRFYLKKKVNETCESDSAQNSCFFSIVTAIFYAINLFEI